MAQTPPYVPPPDWSPPPDYGAEGLPPDLAALLPPPVPVFHAQLPQVQPYIPPPAWQSALASLAQMQAPGWNRSGDWGPAIAAGFLRGLGGSALLRLQQKEMLRQNANQAAQAQAAAKNEANLKATQEQAKARSEYVQGIVRRASARAESDQATTTAQKNSTLITGEMARAYGWPANVVGKRIGDLPPSMQATVAERGSSMAEGTEELTPEAVDIYANERAATGTNKGISVRDIKTIRRVSNRMAQLYPGINLARNAAVFNANRGSLANMTKLHDGVTAFTSTADKNVAVLDEYAVKLGGYDSPLVNRTLRWFEANMKGSPELFAYNAARETVKNEYARILTTLGGSGQVTDTARKEMDSFIRGDLSLKAMREVIDVLRRDARNRDAAYTDAIAQITGRIGASPSGPPDYIFENGKLRKAGP